MRFTSSETAAIEKARKQFPTRSQRGLATYLTKNAYNSNSVGYDLRTRSYATIYSAIRRFDAANRGDSRKSKGSLVGSGNANGVESLVC